MAIIQHKDIPNAQLHEPKDAATASVGSVYVSNGAGSGTWIKAPSSSFKGLTGDGGVAGLRLKSDGTGGFIFVSDVVAGSQVITNNGINFPVTAVADTTFNTPSQFSLLTGAGAPWTSENLIGGLVFSVDRLTVPVTGIYEINLWSNIAGFPNATARVCLRYRINGGAYSTRKPTIKSAVANDVSQLAGFGLLTLNAGDYVQLYIASDTSGNILISDANSEFKLIRQTA